MPSTIILVDHALTRTFDKGALGQVIVEGEPNPEIFEAVEDSPPDTADEGAAASEGPTVSILAGSDSFQPADAADEFEPEEGIGDYSENVLTVPVGTTVTWTNDDSTMHTVTSVDGLFDSGFLREGQAWSYTFTEPGEYEYLCAPHPWMRARVVVEG